ncbi:peptidoglycan DD-metalloendopeptidase family protein [Arthrobacter cryoconiti]|uniref:Peptidoglycan DD-metalloendopeptidase family protein n=1 Tax=Arthrobacter cryoconiti TaxID=748907 RepID=A0ABV8QXA6_9MICC|nr:M23 family metallopeptidase [Arthrobacter cryoconiti]MCC9068992.1 peptidoglycan DD-metalloendopeptidase family protein [Arthrobacter cryoconiti]
MKSTSTGSAGTMNPLRQKPRWQARVGTATTALLMVGLLGLVPAAHADQLDDQAAALQQQADNASSALEFVDSGIAKSASDLVLYQGQLPGAQAALADAQTRVGAATEQVNKLSARIDLAQQNKDKITAQIEMDAKKSLETKSLIGQIAAQSYKAGGLPANLTLLLGVGSTGDLANSIDLAEQATRSQTAVLEKLSTQKATNQNAAARLTAVEAEIKDLKSQADAALVAEQTARDSAAAKKVTVDKLISDSAAINADLEAKKPQIQAKMAVVQQQQNDVAAQIAERQRQEIEAARKAAQAEAERIAREQAANQGNAGYVPPPYVQPAPGNPSAFGLQHPFSGNIPITSGFGWRATPAGTIDFNGTGGYMHTGVDFGATCGTPVYAAAAGTVVIGGWTVYGGGNTVQITHGVIAGNALTTIYYHNSSVVVSPGQRVSQGQLIAYSGSTGNSTGCHAHFETWLNGVPVDPMGLL